MGLDVIGCGKGKCRVVLKTSVSPGSTGPSTQCYVHYSGYLFYSHTLLATLCRGRPKFAGAYSDISGAEDRNKGNALYYTCVKMRQVLAYFLQIDIFQIK